MFVDNAMALIDIPIWTTQDMLKFFKTTSDEALAHGLTSVHDADTNPGFISFYKKLVFLSLPTVLVINFLTDWRNTMLCQ